MLDTPPKEAALFKCVCGQYGIGRRTMCLGSFAFKSVSIWSIFIFTALYGKEFWYWFFILLCDNGRLMNIRRWGRGNRENSNAMKLVSRWHIHFQFKLGLIFDTGCLCWKGRFTNARLRGRGFRTNINARFSLSLTLCNYSMKNRPYPLWYGQTGLRRSDVCCLDKFGV